MRCAAELNSHCFPCKGRKSSNLCKVSLALLDLKNSFPVVTMVFPLISTEKRLKARFCYSQMALHPGKRAAALIRSKFIIHNFGLLVLVSWHIAVALAKAAMASLSFPSAETGREGRRLVWNEGIL